MRIEVMRSNEEFGTVLHFTNDNGITLSMGFGPHYYCEGRNNIKNPQDAEFAVWEESGRMKPIKDDSVAGWVSLNHLGNLLNILAQDGTRAANKIAEYLNSI